MKFRPKRRCKSDPRGFRQGVLVTGAARRQTAEPIRAQPLAAEVRDEPSQAGPSEALVGVEWVAQEGESPALAIIDELGLRDRQEGPSQPDGRRERSLGAHAREARGPTPRQKPHQNGLCLIVAGVSGEHEPSTEGFGMGSEKSVTRTTSGRLNSLQRFTPAPSQGSMRKTERLSQTGDRLGFGARFGPKSVINRGNVNGRCRIEGSSRGHQRGGIGAAGHGEENRIAGQIGS